MVWWTTVPPSLVQSAPTKPWRQSSMHRGSLESTPHVSAHSTSTLACLMELPQGVFRACLSVEWDRRWILVHVNSHILTSLTSSMLVDQFGHNWCKVAIDLNCSVLPLCGTQSATTCTAARVPFTMMSFLVYAHTYVPMYVLTCNWIEEGCLVITHHIPRNLTHRGAVMSRMDEVNWILRVLGLGCIVNS